MNDKSKSESEIRNPKTQNPKPKNQKPKTKNQKPKTKNLEKMLNISESNKNGLITNTSGNDIDFIKMKSRQNYKKKFKSVRFYRPDGGLLAKNMQSQPAAFFSPKMRRGNKILSAPPPPSPPIIICLCLLFIPK